MFGGIGSGLVVLKKLQIAMKKVVHVDIDAVAQHVVRFKHDITYNERLVPDDIEHVFEYSMFEDVVENLDKFMEQHGPIDIILGGPPCSDFSQVNAVRQGSRGSTGKLLPEFGRFINCVRNHPRQAGRPLFFLSENVIFKEFDDMNEIRKEYGVFPVSIDASRFSPCQRKRFYWTSVSDLYIVYYTG